METNATRMCALLVGLPDVNVLAVDGDEPAMPLRVPVETRVGLVGCRGVWNQGPAEGSAPGRVGGSCGVRAAGGAGVGQAPLVVPRGGLRGGHVHGGGPADRAARAKMTDLAGRWATVQVGRLGRTVAEVAAELGCDWHTVMDAVAAYGTALLAADTSRT